MLLRNFCKCLCFGVSGGNKILVSTKPSNVEMSKTQDNPKSMSGYMYSNTGTRNSSLYFGYYGIALGTDDTPPTFDDTRINIPLNSENPGLEYSNNTLTSNYDNAIYTQSVTNTTDADIIVKEVGLFRAETYDDLSYLQILLTRNVINPVTIKPGETKTFTIKIDYTKFSDAYSAS